MKDKLKLLGWVNWKQKHYFRIETNSHSILFGAYRLSKSSLKKKLKAGKGKFLCHFHFYNWKFVDGGITDSSYGNRISPATYWKIVEWSKSK